MYSSEQFELARVLVSFEELSSLIPRCLDDEGWHAALRRIFRVVAVKYVLPYKCYKASEDASFEQFVSDVRRPSSGTFPCKELRYLLSGDGCELLRAFSCASEALLRELLKTIGDRYVWTRFSSEGHSSFYAQGQDRMTTTFKLCLMHAAHRSTERFVFCSCSGGVLSLSMCGRVEVYFVRGMVVWLPAESAQLVCELTVPVAEETFRVVNLLGHTRVELQCESSADFAVVMSSSGEIEVSDLRLCAVSSARCQGGAPYLQNSVRGLAEACVVCLDRDGHFAFVPCGHRCVCEQCHGRLSRCPLCRAPSTGALRIF